SAPASRGGRRMSDEQPDTKPSLRQKMKPVELLGMSAFFAVVAGGIVLMASRQWELSLIFAAVAFIASLVILATLLIAVGPKIDHDRVDPVDPDAPTGTAGSVHRDPQR